MKSSRKHVSNLPGMSGIMPAIVRTRLTMATFATGEKHHGINVYRTDMRSLERNKYAPWGRGTNCGLPT